MHNHQPTKKEATPEYDASHKSGPPTRKQRTNDQRSECTGSDLAIASTTKDPGSSSKQIKGNNTKHDKGCRPTDHNLLQDLKAFKAKYGHCNVPYIYLPQPVLGRWVCTQRYLYTLNWGSTAEETAGNNQFGLKPTLTSKMKKSLDDLGFVWDAKKAIWDENYWKAMKKDLYVTAAASASNNNNKGKKGTKRENGSIDESVVKEIEIWIDEQTDEYISFLQGEETKLNEKQARKLEDLIFIRSQSQK